MNTAFRETPWLSLGDTSAFMGRHPGFHRWAFGFSRLVVPPGFDMVGGLGPLLIGGQAGLSPVPRVKRALGPLSKRVWFVYKALFYSYT